MTLNQQLSKIQKDIDFSGSIKVNKYKKTVIEESYGFANRSEQIKNHLHTRFGIASGCKLFTAISICQLVEAGKLTFETKLKNCLNIDLSHWDEEITVHHLLTHTSGIPDYFDEDEMDDFEELWVKTPMYHIRSLQDFLPLFMNKGMKSKVGEKFHYNNAGYILLGLVVEQVSGQYFTDYIEENIFRRAGMNDSGYFEMDRLPEKTALGYIDFQDGSWKTNTYSLPVKGGSDGGAYVTACDMIRFWEALINHQLLNKSITDLLLNSHVQVREEGYYGYGVWIKRKNNQLLKYHVMGYDPGVSFHSAYYPSSSHTLAVCSNKSDGAFDMMKVMEEELIVR
ncbi:serine hydrolase [Bacillus carboniphilus]|uniref:Serine hydrolase n=1 Tax=Bacillus carboniphilus TaxID=86663 RepID=A0ABY9JRZ9_9BACI|nr:serine hydrolase [Bacillus carboniphilus]WLR42187.1 serine hydrolase [Bacillus carboniphilus]